MVLKLELENLIVNKTNSSITINALEVVELDTLLIIQLDNANLAHLVVMSASQLLSVLLVLKDSSL